MTTVTDIVSRKTRAVLAVARTQQMLTAPIAEWLEPRRHPRNSGFSKRKIRRNCTLGIHAGWASNVNRPNG
jgi:hypothetical protein